MAERTYEIKWTLNAKEDYYRVVNYLLQEWTIKIAAEFIDITEAKLSALSRQPFIGNISEKKPSVRSILLTKHNRMYYRISNDHIELLNIFDTRQNPAKNPFE